MEDNNELKDLVLDDKDDGSNSRKMRKLLIIIASLVILFLIILFVMKMLNSSTTKDQNEGRIVVPPEIETVQKNEPNDTIFEQVPILKDENESQKQSFEDIVKNLKEKEELRQASTSTEALPPQTTPKEQANKPVDNKKDQSIVKAEEKKDTKPETKSENKKDSTHSSKAEAKKDTKHIKQSVSINNKTTTDAKKNASSAPKTSASSSSVGAGTYVQVASLSKVDANNELFKKLKNSGYDYKVYETTVNGSKINKILVGPYDGSKADATLKDIRSKVNPNAFIFKVK